MQISNITFLEEKDEEYNVLNLINGNEEITNFLLTLGAIEIDKIIDFKDSVYNVNGVKLEIIDKEFLNLDLYLKKLNL